MSLYNKSQLSDLIEKVEKIATKKEADASFLSFLPMYFEEAQYSDLVACSPADLLGAAACHYALAQQRKKGLHQLRIYNPAPQDGWETTHTVIDIVNDDMAFLVDSITLCIARHDLSLHLLNHPVLAVKRDDVGQILAIKRTEDRSLPLESFMHLRIDKITDVAKLAELEADLNEVLLATRAANLDEKAMRAALLETAEGLATSTTAEPEMLAESLAFLQWMNDNHFLYMGYCDYDLVDENGRKRLKMLQSSGLGILKSQGDKQYSASFDALTDAMRAKIDVETPVILNKSSRRSLIHRNAHLDFIAVRRFNEAGLVIGERHFLGLYTAEAYHASVRQLPILRQKVSRVAALCDYVDNSHKAKTLFSVLENYPREEMFQIDADILYPIADGIVVLQDRPRVRVFLRQDRYNRYLSALIFVPRDNFSTEIRLQIQGILCAAANLFPQKSDIDFNVEIGDTKLARVHYVIKTPANFVFETVDVALLENDIAQAVRGFRDDLQAKLLAEYGEEQGNAVFQKYRLAFSVAYRADFDAHMAVQDVAQMETLTEAQPIALRVYQTAGAANFNLRLFRLHAPLPLSQSLPILENMGAKVNEEHPYSVLRADGITISVSDFALELDAGAHLQNPDEQRNLEELILRVIDKATENDGFNRLTLAAGLNWRDLTLVRALAKYLRQAGFTFSQTYVENCVASYPSIVQNLVSLFYARLHPSGQNELTAAELENAILVQFNQVSNLDDDKILQGLLQVILATCRTSFWQLTSDGKLKNHIAFKLISNAMPFLPQPRPLFEIWVYSPRMEGVHLRGSKVARGGLRWSDRMEDFRTEVLGLVKAQMVKNSVIVPMGSKGGFVCKNLPAPSQRDAFLAEGIACYKLFISALLELTDNLVNGQVQAPANVHCRDEVDPYLVVAADKGTATFSDIANGVSAEYGFWLDDAFASGGSVGYDHKAMGITARGAWEAIKRHFRHLGKNIQTEEFTVIGIGDMAGDVFGNGMLLSEHICLLAAFNHQHIFLDPQPHAANSFAERKRLFQLPRSSWADYNPALISAGGGVFERSAKSIPLSAEVRAWLKTKRAEMPPLELINTLLQAEADLLYNGGIGTYIKASDESHADAKDRANDALRVNGNQLRVKVVGEGGNLGCTQKGRIEYALNGGNIYTDAIDNSAGVDCSDHEVNIKILLGSVVQAQQMTTPERNVLLASMTEEVGALVLRNNYLQTQALAFNQHFHAPSMLSTHARMMGQMEKIGFLKLHREIEFLPNEAQLAARKSARLGLSAPEIAVLMAYNKINLDQALLNTTLPDEADFASILVTYFPKALQTQFADAMNTHHLKREIISNQLANLVINRMGTTFLFRMKEAFPCDEAAICRAWWLASRSLNAEQLWLQLEALDSLVAADLQIHGMMMVRTLVERATRWFLTHKRTLVSGGGGLQAAIDAFAPKVAQVMQALPRLILAQQDPEVANIEAEFDVPNMPRDLAAVLARLSYAVPVFDIIELADANAVDLLIVAQNYYEMGEALQLNWLRVAITGLPRDNRWQSLARSALRDDLYRQHAQLLQAALDEQQGQAAMTQNWLANRAASVALCHGMFSELQSYSGLDLAMLSAGMRELNSHLTTA